MRHLNILKQCVDVFYGFSMISAPFVEIGELSVTPNWRIYGYLSATITVVILLWVVLIRCHRETCNILLLSQEEIIVDLLTATP